MKKVIGYCDPWSVAPGESLEVMVSTYGESAYDVQLVRVICGDDRALGPGFKEQAIDSPINGRHPGREQACAYGSYVQVPHRPPFAALESLSVQAFIWPTTPDKGRQGLIAKWSESDRSGFALTIDEQGCLALTLGDGRGGVAEASSGKALAARQWYFVGASFDAASGELRLIQRPLTHWPVVGDDGAVVQASDLRGVGATTAPLLMGALPAAEDGTAAHYNGKIDRPRLARRALGEAEMAAVAVDAVPPRFDADLLAVWDFAQGISGDEVVDASANRLDGTTVNLPARGSKGHNWTGECMAWTEAPEQFAAIHFHDDMLVDAGWEPDFTLTLPEDARSGVYAVRLEAGGDPFYVTFFVRPPRGRAAAPLAFLASTATYIAYGNYKWMLHEPLAEVRRGQVQALTAEEAFLQEHPEVGLSTYDTHSDGSGVRYGSRLRPILNMGPMTRIWSFNADTHILDWLEAKGHAYDVITDEDLHDEGIELLEPYKAIVTGTHPEYWSTPMWQAMAGYQRRGGRLMYLGGNGFYWRIAFHPTRPGVIELRRTEDGARYWAEEPGESYMGFNGEYGGLWRRAGIAPQTLVGVGTRATGFDRSSYYRRTPESFDPRVAFIFEGIGEDELIGAFGSLGNGASGVEIDAADARLGTPPHALVIASSEEHSEQMYLAPEETNFHHQMMSGADSPEVRADMVFYECPNGGAVFSTGSIAWAASLAHDGYDNNVSRITDNVLRRFLEEEGF